MPSDQKLPILIYIYECVVATSIYHFVFLLVVCVFFLTSSLFPHFIHSFRSFLHCSSAFCNFFIAFLTTFGTLSFFISFFQLGYTPGQQ